MKTLHDIRREFPADPETGLSAAQVAASRTKFGRNVLTPLPREPLWKAFLAKFDDPIIRILLGASWLKILIDVFDASQTAGLWALIVSLIVAPIGFPFRALRPWLPAVVFGLGAALVGVSVALGHPSYDGIAVMIAVALATGVAFAAEYRSHREFDLLNAVKDAIQVKVRRDGAVHSIGIDEVVVGDCVLLETGDEIPADGRIAQASELDVDQSLMTGESESAHKSIDADGNESHGPDQPGCVYRGTQIVGGGGVMRVAEVGDATMLGQIARSLGGESSARVHDKLTTSRELTPLQRRLERLARQISIVGYVAAAAIFIVLVAGAILDGRLHWPADAHDWLVTARLLLDFSVIVVVIIVVAVPEGLPMSVTISLALAMRKMTRANCLVRQLVACETIGSATVICSDKTGTLTQNKMQVVEVVVGETKTPSPPAPLPQSRERGEGVVPAAERGVSAPESDEPESKRNSAEERVETDRIEQPHQSSSEEHTHLPSPGFAGEGPGVRAGFAGEDLGVRVPLDLLILNAAVNSTAELETKDGREIVIGNSTEGALLRWLRERGVDYRQLRHEHPVLSRQHFSSEQKRMLTVIRDGQRFIALVKGAPEILLAASSRVLNAEGETEAWTDSHREDVEDRLRQAAEQAIRTLAFAVAEVANPDPVQSADLTFIGYVAIRDPLRPDVREAIHECRAAGIDVKLVTGDVSATATAIARDIGLLDDPELLALSSADFEQQSDAELMKQLPRLRVLARARPLDKLRLVELLQRNGEVVAMTGDGTNDAPSLKKADVGLSMGVAGTEVAKEASKIVILDDAFATIVRAVHWGRALYENIQRFVQFQLTINLSALVIAFAAPILGFGEPPFTVLQFLWINIIMDTAAAVALCAEPPRAGLMREKPKRRDDHIITPTMLRTIVFTAVFFVGVMLLLLIGMRHWGWFAGAGAQSAAFPLLTARQATIFFTTYVLFQVWNMVNCRSLTPEVSGFAKLGANRPLLIIAALIVAGQFVIVTFGGRVFQVEPLHWIDWAAMIAATFSVVIVAEIRRRIIV